jgi:hypothetical protein
MLPKLIHNARREYTRPANSELITTTYAFNKSQEINWKEAMSGSKEVDGGLCTMTGCSVNSSRFKIMAILQAVPVHDEAETSGHATFLCIRFTLETIT